MAESYDYSAEYLDPEVWNRIGVILSPFQSGALIPPQTEYNKISEFYKEIQTREFMDCSIIEYTCKSYDEYGKVFGKKSRSTENTLMRFLKNEIVPSKTYSIIYWITDGKGDPFFHCILYIADGNIKVITTADRYHDLTDGKISLSKLQELVFMEFKTPVEVKAFTIKEWDEYAKKQP